MSLHNVIGVIITVSLVCRLAVVCGDLQDLCVLSRGEQGQWIKRTSVSATLGLELVEQVQYDTAANGGRHLSRRKT